MPECPGACTGRAVGKIAMIPKTIALIGTFDTKGEELAFLRDRIESAGLRTLVIDVGVLGIGCLTSRVGHRSESVNVNQPNRRSPRNALARR